MGGGTHARRRDFVIETRIADGGAGRIYRGTFRGVPAALKEVRLEGLSVDEPADAAAPGFFAAVPPARALAEAALLRSLRCPDVVAAVGCFSHCGRLFTVLELGTRDLLEPENVLLLGTHGRPVLCDFDRARDEREPRPRPGGSPEYAPPELLDAGASGPAGDVYQLGVLLYELLAGATPFKASSVDRTLALVSRGAVPPPPAACSRDVAALLAPTASGLLTPSKPKLRPRAAALRDRPVFAAARDMDPPELPD
ncbi:cAMP-dependent protein kinase [Aureococcus anophagefferens]|nr:cAMP-dependent protein kinase [Aureococcus anophagefferens]